MRKHKKRHFQIQPIAIGQTMKKKNYNIALSLFTIYGFLINAIQYLFLKDFFFNLNPIVFLIAYIVLGFGGIIVSNSSTSAIGAFIGYNMLIAPLGGMLSCALHSWFSVNPEIVFFAFIGTAIVTGIMLVFSFLNPDLFTKHGGFVFVVFLATVVAELILYFIMGDVPQFFSYIIVAIMSFFVAYDFAAANKAQYTMRNAIVFASNLWLDILNIFTHFIDIFLDD